MPVNHDFTGSLINAFQTGRGIRQQQEELTAKQEKEKADEEYRQKVFEENKKEFKAEQDRLVGDADRTRAYNDAMLKITQANAEREFLKDQQATVKATGQAPAGYTKTAPHTYTPFPGNEHPGFTANTPEEQALIDVEANAPALKAQTAQQMEVFNVQQGIRRADQAQQNEFELEKQRQDNASAREIANLRASNTTDPTKAAAIHAESPVTPTDRDLFGVPEGTLYKEIYGRHPGVKLSAAQQSKVDYLDEMIKNAVEADNLLDPEKGGIGYESYYLGKPGLKGIASGVGTEFLANRKGESDPKVAAIRNRLASNFDRQKIESAGKVLSPAELEVLRQYNIPYEHSILPAQGKTNLKQFIANTIAMRDKLVNAENRVVGGTQNDVDTGDIYFNANNEIITKAEYDKLYRNKK